MPTKPTAELTPEEAQAIWERRAPVDVLKPTAENALDLLGLTPDATAEEILAALDATPLPGSFMAALVDSELIDAPDKPAA